MNLFGFVSDAYEREARLIPALFACLPLIILCGLLAPSLRTDAAWLLAVLAGGGGFAMMRAIIRDRGKSVEPKLWEQWGGMPSLARLRHRDPVFAPAETVSFHAKAVAKISGLTAPTPSDEAADPEAADVKYRQMSRWILSNTRSAKDHPLILKHNIGYGFRRNIYGAKPVILLLDAVLIIAAIAWILFAAGVPRVTFDLHSLDWRHAAALIVPALHMIFVSLVATKAWVKQAADAFSEQLIGAFHTIE